MISVVVPIYNASEYLRVCLDSIINQTYKDLEIILIDDGSTDKSEEICHEYASKDSRIVVIHQNNCGPAKARNAGISVASGEYLMFVDADDAIHPDCIGTLFEGIDKHNASIAVCEHVKFQNNAEIYENVCVSDFKYISGVNACDKIVNRHDENMIVVWGKLYSNKLKDLLFMPEGKAFEDEFISYKLMYSSAMVAKTDAKLYYYRQRKDSLSNEAFSKKYLDRLEALKGAADWLKEKKEKELFYHAQKRYLLAIEIAWDKAIIGKADQVILDSLKNTHKAYYSANKKNIWECCNLTEKIALQTFRLSPKLYSIIAELYLKIFDNN